MDSNVDVLKELGVKNKEIYLNKLNIDLNTNLENLLITISNIIEFCFSELNSKMNDLIGYDSENVVSFQNNVKDGIINLIKKRTGNFKKEILNIDNIDYREILDNGRKTLIIEIEQLYKKNVNLILKNLPSTLDKFKAERLTEYITNIFYEKMMNKIKSAINNLDVILYNNYKDSYIKFQNINKKTLK